MRRSHESPGLVRALSLGVLSAGLLLVHACSLSSDTSGLSDRVGEATPCAGDADCDDDDPCSVDRCDAASSVCVYDRRPDGLLPAALQTEGDCQQLRCEGGRAEALIDDEDLPDDGNDCTEDLCWSGSATHVNLPAGQLCGSGGGRYCDGAGSCVGCNGPTDCPGIDGACAWRTCDDHQCGMHYVPEGEAEVDEFQVAGDCTEKRCDGAGGELEVFDPADPADDLNECTDDVCVAASGEDPRHTEHQPRSGIDEDCSAGYCLDGRCVGCQVASECCSGANCPSGDCYTHTCHNNVCGVVYEPAGFILAAQEAGDCTLNVCDGAGHVVGAADPTDPEDDGDPCTTDECVACEPTECIGVKSVNAPLSIGSPCSATSCVSLTEQQNADTCQFSAGTASGLVCEHDADDTTDCAASGYVCYAGQCAASCTSNAMCATDHYCDGGYCVGQLFAGVSCVNAGECLSGFCVDGVCCNSPCYDVCLACSATKKGQGLDGICGAIEQGLDPDDECAASDAETCGHDGTCDGAGHCRKWAFGTICAAASCSGSTLVAADVCDGDGTCLDGGSLLCGAYVCRDDGTGCRTSCVGHDDCGPDHYCDGSQCVLANYVGVPCTEDAECFSGSCSDGFCCDAACGACHVCSVAAGVALGMDPAGLEDGHCVQAPAGTDPGNMCPCGVCDQYGQCEGGAGCT